MPLVAVRSFHRFCVDEGHATEDPTEDVKAPKVPAGIPKALTEAEVGALLDSVVGDDARALRDRAILETLYASGMRITELVALDREDLALDDGLVRVFGKGAKERVVPIGRPARAALETYLARGRPELTRAGASTRGAGDAVLLNARGGRLTRQGCWGIVRDAGGRAGLGDRVHPHVLRHSCATHLLDHGADIRVVQEVLGHASVSTTQVYTKVSPERLRAVYLERASPVALPNVRRCLTAGPVHETGRRAGYCRSTGDTPAVRLAHGRAGHFAAARPAGGRAGASPSAPA